MIQQLYIQSDLLRILAPAFSEIENLFYDKYSSIGVVKDRLNKLWEQVGYYLDIMSEVEFSIIRNSYLGFYFKWLACIGYYGGGHEHSIDFLNVAEYN